MTLRGGLTAVYFCGLCDLAIAVYDCGALGECDRLAGFALCGVGLFWSMSVTVQCSGRRVCYRDSFVALKHAEKGTKYFDHERGAAGDVQYQP